VEKHGFSGIGKQRYICNTCKKTFQQDYTYNACHPGIKSQIYFQTINGSGTRAIARSLNIDPGTVTATLRAFEPLIWHINYDYLDRLAKESVNVELVSGTEVEMDEMWSFVHDKSQQYWLWWAIDHNTGEPLAFYFGTREHESLVELKKLLVDFNISIVYADGNPAYEKHMDDSEVITGKRNTQNIERKHLSLRTWCSRLVRKGIRFSKSHTMHAIVVSLVINHWFFGRVLT
jgi:IS1 family transposase